MRLRNGDGFLGVLGAQGREESRVSYQDLPQGMGAENEESPLQAFCYRAGDKTKGLDLEECGER